KALSDRGGDGQAATLLADRSPRWSRGLPPAARRPRGSGWRFPPTSRPCLLRDRGSASTWQKLLPPKILPHNPVRRTPWATRFPREWPSPFFRTCAPEGRHPRWRSAATRFERRRFAVRALSPTGEACYKKDSLSLPVAPRYS